MSKRKTRTGLKAAIHATVEPFYVARRAVRIEAAGLWRRLNRRTTFIGITGNHGKSTATVLLGAMLRATAPTKLGVFNNSSKYAARTVLSTAPWRYRYCVQEVSGFPRGNIDKICRALQPQVGIVTAVGGDHRQVYRTFEATAEEKSRLVQCLPADGLAVLNDDDPHVAGMASVCHCRVVRYGRSETADLRLLSATSVWPDRLTLEVAYRGETFAVRTQLVGAQWQVSVMAALLAALELGIARETCLSVIAAHKPIFDKMSVHPAPGGAWFVLDTHKLSFYGVEACLGFLKDARAPRRSVLLGTISDHSGGDRRHYHRVARLALEAADRVIFTGANAARARRLMSEFPDRLFIIEDRKEAAAFLSRDLLPGEVVYIKAADADRLTGLFPVER